MMRKRNWVSLAMACVLLSACGGGGGGELVSTPPPPTPPAVTYANFNNLTSDQQIDLGGITKVTTGSNPASVVNRPASDGTLSLSYSILSGTYVLRTAPLTMGFGPAEIRSDAFGPRFTTYQKVNGDTTDVSGVYRPAGNPGGNSETYSVPLSYTTLIARASVTSNPDGTQTRQDSFLVGGFRTLASDMPRTGVASYSGNLRALQNNNLSFYDGSARLIADFSALTVTTDLFLNQTGKSTLLLNGSGTISSALFKGTLTGSGFTGTFDGGFFGPKAAEMGYSFFVRHDDGTMIGGVAAGRN